MQPAPIVPIKDSIATTLFTVVFSLYLIVASTLTLLHMVSEFENTEDKVLADLQLFQKTFETSIARAMWDYDMRQLNAIVLGMVELPGIVGVKIEDERGDISGVIGEVLDAQGQKVAFDSYGNRLTIEPGLLTGLFQHQFPLVYTVDGEEINQGVGVLYSNKQVVWQKVQSSFVFIMISAAIKTIALWVIFLWISRKRLSRPLSSLIQGIQQLEPDHLHHLQIVQEDSGHNEIRVLEVAFNAMVQKLLDTQNKQEELHVTMEQQIQQRIAETEKIATLTNAFERFVPRQFLQRMEVDGMEAIHPGYYQGETLTMLFSDIRSFTQLSESMTTDENFQFINNYLDTMEPCITQNEGFVDKFIGDAIMALFDREHSGYQAIQSAIAMHKALVQFNESRVSKGLTPIRIGVGINTGLVTIGVVGSETRMDSTVIGDHVNLASRVEGLTKLYNAKILISGFTHAVIDHSAFHIREIDTIKVKGKQQPITLYEVFDADEPDIIEKKLATRDMLWQGIVKFKLQEFKEAIPHFEACLQQFPNDVVPVEYIKRCYYLGKYPPRDVRWDGVMQDTDYTLHQLLKRRSPRFSISVPIDLYTRNQREHFAAHLLDVSQSGVKVATNSELEMLDTMMMEIFFKKSTLDEFMIQRPLIVLGQVAWKRQPSREYAEEGWIYGIEFVMLTEKDEQTLKDELLQLALSQEVQGQTMRESP